VTEIKSHDAEMDRLLLQSMGAPVPALPSNFDRRVLREVNRNSDLVERYRWMLLTAYAAVSALTSLVIMRDAGLGWLPIIGILAPVTLISAAFPAWKTKPARIRPSEV
jgi:hypothetical protein